MKKLSLVGVALALAAACASVSLGVQQRMSSLDADRCREMLKDAHEAIQKHYYDVKFHGIDMDGRYTQYAEKMKQATTLGQAFTIVAAYLSALQDSHTFFLPPPRAVRYDYGYRMQIVGDSAFVTDVRPKTDAANYLAPGDQVLKFFQYDVNRADFPDLRYYLNVLSPQPLSKLDIRSPAGQERQVAINTTMKQMRREIDLTGSSNDMDIWQYIREIESENHLLRQRYVESGDVVFWKMPEFDMNQDVVSRMFGIIRKHKALILDLRGNPGGAVDTLTDVSSYLFDHDFKIADRIGRKADLKPTVVKSRGNNAFGGKLVVLIDSRSASAAELLSRVVELEKRGTVIGDRSSGSVMESRIYQFAQGADTKVFYNLAVTDADLIMKDGKSLEHVGVTPDEIVLPTADDMAKGRDPVLTRAANIVGLNLDPQAAGKMFPFEWNPD
jgi:Peptidase family S41/Tricorn protease C1 domain